jgi:ATP-dependent DNA helicase RecG
MRTDIKEIIKTGESETVEFKQTTGQLTRAVETLCAFANHKGGVILFGVTDKGKITGQPSGDSTLRTISDTIAQSISPSIYPSVVKEEADGKPLILVSLPESTSKPYTANGRPYKRLGTTTRQMSSNEYEHLLLERNRHRLCWDMELNADITTMDIDEGQLRLFVRTAQNARNLSVSSELPIEELLVGLDLMKERKLTNAAMALFGKRPQTIFHHLTVKAARFKGTTKDEFIDNQLFSGNLFELYQKLQAFFSSHIRIAGKTSRDFSLRKDTPDYPLEALREASINALIHRDYYNPHGSTEAAVYDDRIEIWNNGLLASGLNVESLYKPHRSVPRNPLLARAFFLFGATEAWGRGTLKMIGLCKDAGLPSPEISENSGGIEVRFTRLLSSTEKEGKLKKTQEKIIAYLRKRGSAKSGDIAKALQISDRTVQRNLAELNSFIEWTGESKYAPNGLYRLK